MSAWLLHFAAALPSVSLQLDNLTACTDGVGLLAEGHGLVGKSSAIAGYSPNTLECSQQAQQVGPSPGRRGVSD